MFSGSDEASKSSYTSSDYEPFSMIEDNDMKEGFIEGCMEEDAIYSECLCLYKHILNDMGKERLMEASIEYAETNMMDGDFIDSASEAEYCFN